MVEVNITGKYVLVFQHDLSAALVPQRAHHRLKHLQQLQINGYLRPDEYKQAVGGPLLNHVKALQRRQPASAASRSIYSVWRQQHRDQQLVHHSREQPRAPRKGTQVVCCRRYLPRHDGSTQTLPQLGTEVQVNICQQPCHVWSATT